MVHSKNIFCKMHYIIQRKLTAFTVLCFFGFAISFNLTAKNISTPSFESPYHTIYTHLHYLQAGNFKPDIAGKALNVPAEKRNKQGELAVNLKQILDGHGLYVNMDDLPRDPNYIDTVENEHKYILFSSFPDIYVEKIDGQWLYSEETVNAIPELYKSVYPFGLDRIIGNLPDFFYTPLLGLEYWQYLGIIILIIIGIAIHKFLSFVLGYLLATSVHKLGYEEIGQKHIPAIARPLSIWLLVIVLLSLIPALQLPVWLTKYIMQVLNLLVYIMIIVVLYRMVDLVGAGVDRVTSKRQGVLEDQVKPVMRKLLKVMVVVVGILFILQNFDFDITTLLAGLSLGGLAFALAAQDTIKNFFGSMLIFADKPFKVGDWISFNNMDGTVEEVGLRSTRVRTFYNSLIYIPNGRLSDMAVDNFGERMYRRFFTTISITYDTPPVLIEKYVKGLRLIVEDHPDTRKDFYNVYLNEYNASSLDIMFYIFFKVPDWPSELRAREEIMLRSIRLAHALGVRFAFPTQTLHVEAFPTKGSTTPNYTTDPKELDNRIEKFIQSK